MAFLWKPHVGFSMVRLYDSALDRLALLSASVCGYGSKSRSIVELHIVARWRKGDEEIHVEFAITVSSRDCVCCYF